VKLPEGSERPSGSFTSGASFGKTEEGYVFFHKALRSNAVRGTLFLRKDGLLSEAHFMVIFDHPQDA
jgi:hypothetical protein